MRKKLHSPWAVLVITLIASACTSRTTPLPPPEVNTVSRPNGDGDVTVVGLALEGASVGVVNERTLEGTITTPQQAECRSVCEFKATLKADSGDDLRVWQFFETEGGIEANVP